MILKSYEIKKNKIGTLKNNLFLVYGENLGLKKDIKNFITSELKQKNGDLEILSFYENEIINNKDNFFNSVYSGSLFSKKKIITINETTDKIIDVIKYVHEKCSEDIYLIFVSNILDKKSKIRTLFEKENELTCIACYLDNEKDLATIAHIELKKNNLTLSRESINLLIEKSNADRNNLRNEIEKIIAYSHNKEKIEVDEIKTLINFSGDYKSDIFVNECLCGNITQYKKIISEFYVNTINQILLLRILSNKIHRLLKIKEETDKSYNLDAQLNACKPPIFWKEKPIVKKQLALWKLKDLKEIIADINKTEILCKKNPNISASIFLNFFMEICKKANSFS
ncbi:DNA polymerase III subunit delta [Pelagibacteraceae bacterium]|nr:DNA polymerase III subunit delta [Pelagibacteraceae bacterium]